MTVADGRFIQRCPSCPYSGPAIGSRGDPASRLVLVGEAPGVQEIAQGRPFVGPAGRILSDATAAAGLVEDELYIVNAIACKPVPVRPRVAAIRACHDRLMAELNAHPRRVVVTLGATALRAVTGSAGSVLIERHVGPRDSERWVVVPTVHPAWVLRWEADRFEQLKDDLKTAARISRMSAAEDRAND